jgi:hypothetical protein
MRSSKSFDPIIVVGPGRSGTTVVARLLHERLGISMGDRFRSDPEGKCYYEDLDFRDLNRHFMDGVLNFNEWLQATERNIFIRKATEQPWGFKDPRASYIMGMYFMFFRDPLFVRCRRDRNDVAKSMSKNYGWPMESALNVARERDVALDGFLRGREVLGLYFDEWQDEEELLLKIKERLHVHYDRRCVPRESEIFQTLGGDKDVGARP